MKKKIFLFGISLLAFAACNSKQLPTNIASDCFNHLEVKSGKLEPVRCPDNRNWRIFRADRMEISLPGQIYLFKNESKSTTFDTNPTNDAPKETDYYLQIYSLPLGSQTKMGVKIPSHELLSGISVWKGRVDFYDQFRGGENPDPGKEPLCRGPGGGSAYALYSEKDGKAVLICISQIKNNPELAEQIFQTFRWNK